MKRMIVAIAVLVVCTFDAHANATAYDYGKGGIILVDVAYTTVQVYDSGSEVFPGVFYILKSGSTVNLHFPVEPVVRVTPGKHVVREPVSGSGKTVVWNLADFVPSSDISIDFRKDYHEDEIVVDEDEMIADVRDNGSAGAYFSLLVSKQGMGRMVYLPKDIRARANFHSGSDSGKACDIYRLALIYDDVSPLLDYLSIESSMCGPRTWDINDYSIENGVSNREYYAFVREKNPGRFRKLVE
jgi:hypothetical protein